MFIVKNRVSLQVYCEERSDEAIPRIELFTWDCFVANAPRNDNRADKTIVLATCSMFNEDIKTKVGYEGF
ncbi:MAG: hypothetical protein FWC80_04195 [Firmicutes bacterium]|nr:hypothetical protein [Bacillota bacterium]